MNNLISKRYSVKIKLLSFIAIMLVVYLHSYNLKVNYDSNVVVVNDVFNYYLQGIFSQGLTRIAVPLFFLFSGFLFFLSFELSFDSYIKKIRKRFYSILLPYLIWTTIGFFFIGGILMLPQFSNFIVSYSNENYYHVDNYIDQVIHGSVQYQFWFLRHLLVYVIFSPIIYLYNKKLGITSILTLILFWFTFDNKYPFFHSEGLLFFSVGGYVSILLRQRPGILRLADGLVMNNFWLLSLLWIALCVVRVHLCYINNLVFPTTSFVYLTKISILIGIASIWAGYDKFSIGDNTIILSLSSFTFFIYAFHEPTLVITKKILFILVGSHPISVAFIYILAPVIVICFSFFICKFLQRFAPIILRVLSGGRS